MKARDGTRAHSSSPTCTHRIVRAELASDGGPARVSTVLEVTDDEPSGLGWLPDGRMLVVAMETQRLLRLEPDGTLVEHADLSSLARGSLNDMIVATDGTAYVGDMGVRIQEGGERVPGQTFRVAPDGAVSCAADDLQSPNGHVLTDDGRTLIVAESGGAPHRVRRARRRHPRRTSRLCAARPGLRRRPGGRARRDLPRRRGRGVGGGPARRASCACFAGARSPTRSASTT